MTNFSRATSAFILTASLLLGSVAAVAQTPAPNPDDQAGKTSQAQMDQKADQKDQKQAQAVATTTAKSTKPLSTNEDPNMIGKRNINGGIIAKMSGSTEKEVRMGREAAAEVDRQAKFVDDQLIT